MIGDKFRAVLRRLRHGRGFTAAEMLVVVGLFSVGSLIITATYINFTRFHRRVANAEILHEELRFVSELLVRAARNNPVDYPNLPLQIVSPSSTLSLDTPSSTMKIRLFASSTSPCSGSACLGLSLNNGVTWTPVTGKRISVDRFQIYVNPVRSPFQATGIGSYDNNNQPRVTFLINATYQATSTLEKATASIQTSVSSRVYLR